MRGWETVDTIVTWVLVPLGILSAIAELVAGDVLSAILATMWVVLVYAANREYRGWRRRSNRWARIEREDRDRFTVTALVVKSQVVHSIAETYFASGVRDPEVEKSIRALFLGIAEMRLPSDAPPEVRRLQEQALEASRAGRPVMVH